MLGALPEGDRITLGADKGHDTQDFVEGCRDLGVTPHVSQNTTDRSSRIDARTTRHAGYEVSQRKRRQSEEVFGWMKTMYEDRGIAPQDLAQGHTTRRMDVRVHGRGLQPGTDQSEHAV